MLAGPLCAALLAPVLAADSPDGRWLLSIVGHSSYQFGEAPLGGGLRMAWRVDIRFAVRDGEYAVGNGSAQLVGEPIMLSAPPGLFDCTQVAGTYLDSNLVLHETPRIRFARYPVAGALQAGRVTLQPGYDPPGNYLAVTYECRTDSPLAAEWFALAERGKQVLGRRQDAERRVDGGLRSVRVREVIALPPEAAIELPLVDGWGFSIGAADDPARAEYRLSRDR